MATDLERKTKAIGGIAENYGAAFTPDLLKIWLRMLRQYPRNWWRREPCG